MSDKLIPFRLNNNGGQTFDNLPSDAFEDYYDEIYEYGSSVDSDDELLRWLPRAAEIARTDMEAVFNDIGLSVKPSADPDSWEKFTNGIQPWISFTCRSKNALYTAAAELQENRTQEGEDGLAFHYSINKAVNDHGYIYNFERRQWESEPDEFMKIWNDRDSSPIVRKFVNALEDYLLAPFLAMASKTVLNFAEEYRPIIELGESCEIFTDFMIYDDGTRKPHLVIIPDDVGLSGLMVTLDSDGAYTLCQAVFIYDAKDAAEQELHKTDDKTHAADAQRIVRRAQSSPMECLYWRSVAVFKSREEAESLIVQLLDHYNPYDTAFTFPLSDRVAVRTLDPFRDMQPYDIKSGVPVSELLPDEERALKGIKRFWGCDQPQNGKIRP